MSRNKADLIPAQRAQTRRVLWLLLVYAVVLPLLVWLRANLHVSNHLSLPMAIVAALPVLGIFLSWGRYLSSDQAVTLRRIATATNATMGAAIVWGFLQAFGVVPLIEVYWVPFVCVVMQCAIGCVPLFARRSAGD